MSSHFDVVVLGAGPGAFGKIAEARAFERPAEAVDSEGDLHGYDSNGRKVIIHPADRKVWFLTRNA